MIALFISFATGVLEALILNKALGYVLSGNIKKTVLLLLLKILLYAVSITAVMLFFKADIIMAATGLGVGLPGASVVLFIKRALNDKKQIKGDDTFGDSESD